jgi:TolB protein
MNGKLTALLTIVSAGAALLVLAPASGGARLNSASGEFQLEPTLAFSSTRDHVDPAFNPPLRGAEVYLAAVGQPTNLQNLRRLTDNDAFDGFAMPSPDGKKIVFDSTRLTGCSECPYPGTIDRSDLFVMNTDGTDQTFVVRGSSASWSPDSKRIVFHASASGAGAPKNPGLPGSSTVDSDIFVANVDDLLAGVAQPTNLTNNGAAFIEDDAEWSPDGEKIVYVRPPPATEAEPDPEPELYVMNADGGETQRLTVNEAEERGPTWSPDGTRILFSCRTGTGGAELCVVNADGSGGVYQLTRDVFADLTPTWSLDGKQILFHRRVPPAPQQLYVMTLPAIYPADQCAYDDVATCPPEKFPAATALTSPPGINNIANWGELRVRAGT